MRERAYIERALRGQGLDPRVAVSEYAGHTVPLIRQALDTGARQVVAAGGDGTMHEAVNAILGHPCADSVTFAPFPVGTGNDWCRALGIGADHASLGARCARGRDLIVDIGKALFAGGAPPRYFANVAGCGFDAYVLQRMPGRRWGGLAYLIAVLRGLAGYRPQRMQLDSSEVKCEGRMFVVFVSIGGYCGGGMHVAPAADPRDGAFDVVIIGDLGRFDVLLSLRRLFDGTIAEHPKVRTLRCAQLDLDGAQGLMLEADGELIGRPPVTLRMVRAALRVRVA